jgi:hypothetical protein
MFKKERSYVTIEDYQNNPAPPEGIDINEDGALTVAELWNLIGKCLTK